jgi:hypothetical protein
MTIQRTTVRSLAERNKFSLLIPLVYTIFQHTIGVIRSEPSRLKVAITEQTSTNVLKYGV